MKRIISGVLLLVAPILLAQELEYKKYDWDENPTYKIDEKNKNEDIVGIKENSLVEFTIDKKGLHEYFLVHNVLWLNSDKKIEQNNKVYLPIYSDTDLLLNKARVITPEGKIINLDNSKILTAKNEETGRQLKYFAFEGVTKGSFIEFMYAVKKYPKYDGKRIFIQDDYPKKNVGFDLYAPNYLMFAFKSYNNVPEVVFDTINKEKAHWNLKLNSIKALDREDSSPYNASRGFLVYKADRNISNGVSGFSSYSNVAKNIYKFYYQEPDKKTGKNIDKFIKKIDVSSDDISKKVRNIEDYVKRNIFYSEVYDKSFQDINTILDKKVANEVGMIKLFVSIFNKLNINHQIVLTSERRNIKFDKENEADCFITDFLIYFPETEQYLSPTDLGARYGYPPHNLTDNYGLFIKEVKVGNFTSAVGKINYIKSNKAEDSTDDMQIDVKFDEEDLTKAKIDLKRSVNGYNASYFQPYMHLIKEDDKNEMIEASFAKTVDKDVKIISKTIENDKTELFGIKPFVVNLELETESLVEKAGNKYLFKVGALIGKQVQMYQDKKRVLPYEDSYKRGYNRTITIEIPEGYKISNLDEVTINNSYKKDGKELFYFKSSYNVKDNTVTIKADEYYFENLINVDMFEEYRKVINSAADFNKVVFVLEKK